MAKEQLKPDKQESPDSLADQLRKVESEHEAAVQKMKQLANQRIKLVRALKDQVDA